MEPTLRDYADRVVQSLGLESKDFHQTSFSFSQKAPPKTWNAFTCGAFFPIYRVRAPAAKVSDIKAFINGIQSDNYVILAELDDFNVLCMSRHKKGEPPYVVPLRGEEDYDRVVSVFRKQNFTSDELSAHVAIDASIELLKSGAERDFVNRGLFSNYYLRERMEKELGQRKRDVKKESASFFSHFSQSGIPADFEGVPKILAALGYSVKSADGGKQYILSQGSNVIKTAIVIASPAENLDIMGNDNTVPSIQAVSALDRYPWSILTNGRLWRLYSARVSSASTNYFEVDLEGVTDEKDAKLKFFTGLFSAAALVPKQEVADVDFVLDGGEQYARQLEDDLRKKVFEQQLFLDLVRAVIQHSPKKKYSDEVLADAKKNALKLLYRLLFILYAESRNLLPTGDSRYEQVSLGKVRERLDAMGKDPEGGSAWQALQKLFRAISNGDPDVNVPEYDGELFKEEESLDKLQVLNKHIVPAIRALTEIDGKGIDYQNLGVRQLGSLYEALLEYTISQADVDLVVIKDEILDMSFASDLKRKPERMIQKGDIYLAAGGLARKGTGSYYTPVQIVKFLVKKGLEPIFEDREKKFKEKLAIWRKTGSKEAEEDCTECLLDIRVVDPAMGSGHFLVTVVDEITKWIMSILERHPDAPLAMEIGEERKEIINEQEKKKIKLDTELLTFNVILKRKVMKRCIFGVDINPLAVELAKLSLWLDSFTIGTPLTFFDHHIKAGDSLIGLWMDNLKASRQDNMTLDSWTGNVESISDLMWQVSYPSDLTIEEVKKSRKNYEESRKRSEPLRVLLDMQVAGIIDEDLRKRLPRNLTMVEDAVRKGKLDEVIWAQPVKEAREYAKKYQFFHWELEFPDAFTDERDGFDLVIMNPPWEAAKFEDDDFFSQYHSSFRKMGNKQAKQKIITKLMQDESIAARYNELRKNIELRSSFYRNSQQYNKRGSGDTNLWKLFLERAFILSATNGSLSIVVPSGIINDDGSQDLRKTLLQMRIRTVYEFENSEGIFQDVHRSYKFVLLIADNRKQSESFPAAFYLHDVKSLDGNSELDKFMEVPISLIKTISPDSLAIPEPRSRQDMLLLNKIYSLHPKMNNNRYWSIALLVELHRTGDSKIFRHDGKGWPLIEGKYFHQFINNFGSSEFTVLPDVGLARTAKRREYAIINKQIHDMPRLAMRAIASSTNVRSAIACILPPHSFTDHNVTIILPKKNDIHLMDTEYYKMICYLAGIINSFVFDFLVRLRVSIYLGFSHINNTAVPEEIDGTIPREIIRISAQLSQDGKQQDKISKMLGVKFEQMHMSERIEATARLNALVAHHYKLTRDEYEYLINKFEGFEEDKNLENLKEIKWDDLLIRKLNGEVRKRVLNYYDAIADELKKKGGKTK